MHRNYFLTVSTFTLLFISSIVAIDVALFPTRDAQVVVNSNTKYGGNIRMQVVAEPLCTASCVQTYPLVAYVAYDLSSYASSTITNATFNFYGTGDNSDGDAWAIHSVSCNWTEDIDGSQTQPTVYDLKGMGTVYHKNVHMVATSWVQSVATSTDKTLCLRLSGAPLTSAVTVYAREQTTVALKPCLVLSI